MCGDKSIGQRWQDAFDNYSPGMDDNDIRSLEGTRLNGLPGRTDAHVSKPAESDDFSTITFTQAEQAMAAADEDIAPEHTNVWQDVAAEIDAETAKFNLTLAGTQRDDGWQGATGRAAFNNITSSLKVPQNVAAAASRMSIIVDAFSRCVTATKHEIESRSDSYREDKAAHPERVNEIIDDYNSGARKVMTTIYQPPIDDISGEHPDTSNSSPPNLGGAPGVPDGPSAPGGSPGGGAGSGAGAPDMPGLDTPEVPGITAPASAPAGPDGPGKGPGDAAKGAGDAAKGAGDAAKKAAGQAGDAAKKVADQAADAAKKALGGLDQKGGTGPPEGVLGLGPKGVGGASTAGGTGGGRGGGAGPGAGSSPAKPASPKMATTPTKAAAAPPASRAGVSGQGTPGAGAPAAGNRGAAAGGSVHKANKALRTQRNGQDVVGDAEAVAPVVGDEPQDSPPAKPGSS